jgi:RNA recognition motif-containing protein
MNIYVGNLPYTLQSEELRSVFEAYGPVTSAEIIFDRRTQRSRGYGFVQMSDETSALRAIAELDGAEYKGRNLRVDASNNQPDAAAEIVRRPQPRHQPRRSYQVAPVGGAAVAGQGGGLFGFIRRLLG